MQLPLTFEFKQDFHGQNDADSVDAVRVVGAEQLRQRDQIHARQKQNALDIAH